MKPVYILAALFLSLAAMAAKMANGQEINHTMYVFPDNAKYTVADDPNDGPCPFNAEGWYYSQAGVAPTPDGLVAVYRKSDYHTANYTDIMVAYSSDTGKTWYGHKSIAHADVWNQGSCWVAPQFSKLNDGRLVIIADLGERDEGEDWPMLSQWQKPSRGMANYLFWSTDNGKNWTQPIKIDDVGGEPSYISELSDGTLLYTRTKAKTTDMLWNAPMPWGKNYYYNEVVMSKDGGKTWPDTATLSDDPHQGDCEVGVTEVSKNVLLAATRVGMGGGQFGQPSRFVYSYDNGKSWGGYKLTPFYAQRPIIKKLQSGKLLITYRNRWGTPGTYAVLVDPKEDLNYEPASLIFDEQRCQLSAGTMTIKSGKGFENLVTYTFYPAQSQNSRVEIQARIKVDQAGFNGCNISAGCWISIQPDKVSLGDRPSSSFAIDATQWHHYRIVRDADEIFIYVDNVLKYKATVNDLKTRMVQVGNRQVENSKLQEAIGAGSGTQAIFHVSELSVKVENKEDHSIDWTWDSSKGYPDQFRRDRIVVLDRISAHYAHSGYSGWSQMDDGTIVIADYTVGGNGGVPAKMPFVRAYVTTEDELAKK